MEFTLSLLGHTAWSNPFSTFGRDAPHGSFPLGNLTMFFPPPNPAVASLFMSLHPFYGDCESQICLFVLVDKEG